MNHPNTFLSSFGALVCTLLFSCLPALSQSVGHLRAEGEFVEGGSQKGTFIAAFEWSVDKRNDYVWPFESIRPAHYEAVRMLVVQMPRAWPNRGSAQGSMPLSAARSLKVNGNKLPKPQRSSASGEEFRVYLDNGRLRLSFSLPPGFKLDSQNAIIRIRLYEVE